MRKILLITILSMLVILAACGNNDNSSNQEIDNNGNNNNNNTSENVEEEDKIYQVGETATITSRGYDFEYEATVNEYEITDKSDTYDMNDFYMNYDKNNYDDSYIVISNVTIHNTSDENFTPSKHIPMHVSESGNEAGEDVIFDYFPEFDENLEPGESITGDLI